MDMRRMSNWNALSVEAALQQLNTGHEENGEVRRIRRPNTVRIIHTFSSSSYSPNMFHIILRFISWEWSKSTKSIQGVWDQRHSQYTLVRSGIRLARATLIHSKFWLSAIIRKPCIRRQANIYRSEWHTGRFSGKNFPNYSREVRVSEKWLSEMMTRAWQLMVNNRNGKVFGCLDNDQTEGVHVWVHGWSLTTNPSGKCENEYEANK